MPANLTVRICSKKPTDPDIPEEPTTCCQSGCNNCVWIEYATKLTEIFEDGGEEAQKRILEKISDPALKAFLQMELRALNARKDADKTPKNTPQ